MLEEANSTLHQRRQNVCSNKSMFTLKLLPKHTKQIAKCHALHEYVVVENVENLDVGCCVCVCMCGVYAMCGVYVCVCVVCAMCGVCVCGVCDV